MFADGGGKALVEGDEEEKTCIINIGLFYAFPLPAALFMSNG